MKSMNDSWVFALVFIDIIALIIILSMPQIINPILTWILQLIFLIIFLILNTIAILYLRLVEEIKKLKERE